MDLTTSHEIAGIKSKSGRYIKISLGSAKVLCFEDPKKVVGLDEYRVLEHAYTFDHYDHNLMVEEFLLEDERAMRGESFFIFDVIIVRNKPIFTLGQKSPYIENNKMQGSQHSAVILLQPNFQTVKTFLSNPEIVVSGHAKKHLEVLKLAPSRRYDLTRRELQCIELLIQGHSAKTIAFGLKLSQRTIEFYISNIKQKLGVAKITELVAVAVREGLV